MASDSFIICPDCGTKTIVPPLHVPPNKCHNCSHNFMGYYKCSSCNNFTEIGPDNVCEICGYRPKTKEFYDTCRSCGEYILKDSNACKICGYYKCPLCNNFSKKGPCEICGYNPDTRQLTYKCKTCGEPIRKDASACKICLDWPTGLKNITKSIFALSDFNIDGLIKKEQFEVKVMDIVVSGVSNQISINEMKNYLSKFKKMLDDDHIDENIYDKISDLLLARCEFSEKSQELLTKKIEKTPKIAKIDNSTSESINVEGALVIEEVQPDTDKKHHADEDFLAQSYYKNGLIMKKYKDKISNDEGIKLIAHAAKLGHFEAKRYLKDNKLEFTANNLKKHKPNIRKVSKTEGYLQSNKIEKPPDTYHHDKADVPSKDQTKKGTMGVGVKIIWTIVTLFIGSVVMGLIHEFQGFGILHGLAGIGTGWGVIHIWSRL